MKRIALAALVAAFALPALPVLADDACTEEKAEALSQELFAMLDADPDKAPAVQNAIEEVEAEYGGEPNEAQVCDALQKVIDKVTE